MPREELRDSAVLVFATIVSALPYVFRLGFYSDDWGILAPLTFGGISDIFAIFPGRPVQAVQWALLFTLFGMHPLGYELANVAVIAAAVLLLYLLLVRLDFDRRQSFAAALLFLVLPQLSTVRVWISAAQVPLSMALMLASLHAQLSFQRSGRLLWAALALAATVLSIGAYEIFAPLVLAFPFWLLLRTPGDRQSKLLALAFAVLLLLALLYKIFVSGRAGPIAEPAHYLRGLRKLVSPSYDWRVDTGLNIFAALDVHFALTLEGWCNAAIGLAGAGWKALAAALAVAAMSAWRLLASADGEQQAGRGPAQLLLFGIAAFLLGHATFLVVSSIIFSPSGVGNRVLVAAAIGVAMVFVAIAAILARRNRVAFVAVICVLAFAATLRIERIARFWAEAPVVQNEILAAAATDLAAVPTGSTIILDGVCPYHGPTIVFATPWGVGGALSLALGRPLSGDAVSPRMSIAAKGLESAIYGEPAFYPYSPRLFVYNPGAHVVAALPSAASALAYFRRPGRWSAPCPRGFVGHGVPV